MRPAPTQIGCLLYIFIRGEGQRERGEGIDCITYLSSTFPVEHMTTEISHRVLPVYCIICTLSSTNPHCSLAIYGSI